MPRSSGRILVLLALLAASFVTGCGNFWKAPTGTTTSTVTLTASPTTATVGENVTLTATLSPTAATGTVTFYNGATSIGSGTLSSGTATLTTSFSAAGTDSLTAVYGGDTTYEGSTSSAVSFIVTAATGTTATTTTISPTSDTVAAGTSFTLTGTVSAAAATGTVDFYDTTTSTDLGSGTLSAGTTTATATLTTSLSVAETHQIEAIYQGDSTYATSTSSTASFTVTSSGTTATTTTVSSTSSSVAAGTSFTLTGTVSASAATGTVEFYDTTTSTELGTGTLSAGTTTATATLTTSLSVAETHQIEAIYLGDTTYATSTSSTIAVVVNATPASSSTTITLIASPAAVTAGTGVGLAAIVTPLTSTGIVTFYDGATEIGTASLVSGSAVAALTTTSLAVGSHTITAQYSSQTSNSATVSVTTATAASTLNTNAGCGYTADGATGAYVLSSGTLVPPSGSRYSTSTADQNVLCVTGASTYLTLMDPTITSSSVTTSDNDSSFYGLNAAVLDYNGGDLTIDGGTITTSGAGGNLVFSYGTSIVTISNATLNGISTTGSNEHGIYAAGAGTIVANNVTATSTGPSSSIVATDRGGGTITINGGNYEAEGAKSAGIYSTGVITANNATFTSTSAEAVVIEGDNSVVLSNSTLNSASSGTHRGIFLYQSMSGDASNNSCGTTGDCFEMTNGTLNYTDTTSGNTDPALNCTAFEVYNQTALVTLTDVTVNNSCGTLLLAGYNDQWSNTDAWGYATFKAYGTTLTGDIIIGDTCLTSACSTRDTSSTAAIYLYEDTANTGSKLTGAINTANTGKTVSLTLDAASEWIVTGTSYLTSLTDATSNYSNITCLVAGCQVYIGSTPFSPATH